MGAIERLRKYIELKGISKYRFYQDTGLSNGFLDKGSNIGSDKCEKILYQYPDINPRWLITGQGSMLCDASQLQSEPTRPTVQQDLSGETATYYKMYKEKDAKVEELLKENGRLEERIRQLESREEEYEHESEINDITETFTSESSGDCGEDSRPTKLPSGSKRSSVGKA